MIRLNFARTALSAALSLALGCGASPEADDENTNDKLITSEPAPAKAMTLDSLFGTWNRNDVPVADLAKTIGIMALSIERPAAGSATAGCHVTEQVQALEMPIASRTYVGACSLIEEAAFNARVSWTGSGAQPKFTGMHLLLEVKEVQPKQEGAPITLLAYEVVTKADKLSIALVGSTVGARPDEKVIVATSPQGLKFNELWQ